jgi:competence ComEA-like helix-hairpin-helix protein
MIALTAQEKRVVLFVAAVWLIGLCIQWLVLVKPAAQIYLRGETLKIPLNQATYDELVSSGLVSGWLARRIVEYRAQQGEFRTLEDLKRIKGIKEKRFERLKDIFYIPEKAR